HEELRPEDVDERADAGAEVTAHVNEQLDRLLVAFVRKPDDPVRVRRGPERLLGLDRPGLAAHVCLEMASAGAGALAGAPVVDDHDVTELRVRTDAASIRLAPPGGAAAGARAGGG